MIPRLLLIALLLSMMGCAKTPLPAVPSFTSKEDSLMAVIEIPQCYYDQHTGEYLYQIGSGTCPQINPAVPENMPSEKL